MHFSTSTIGALAVFAAGAHCIDLSNLPGYEAVPEPAGNKYLTEDVADGLLSARSDEGVYNSYEPTHVPEEDLPLEARSEHDKHHAKYAGYPGYHGYVARSLEEVDATEGPTSGEEGSYDLKYEHLSARSEPEGVPADYDDDATFHEIMARGVNVEDAAQDAHPDTVFEEFTPDEDDSHPLVARDTAIPADYDDEATFSASDILARDVADTAIPAGYDDTATLSFDDADIQARDVDSGIPADYDDKATFSFSDSDIQARDVGSDIPADYDDKATFSMSDSDIQARDLETEVPEYEEDEASFRRFMERGIPVDKASQYAHPDTSFEEYESDPHYIQARNAEAEEIPTDYDDEASFHQFMERGIPIEEAHKYAHPDISFEEYESDPHYLQARAAEEDESSFLGEQVAEDDDEATFHQFMARGIPVDEAHEHVHPDTSFEEYESDPHYIQARDSLSATHHSHIHSHPTGVSATGPTVPPTAHPTHHKHIMHARAASSLSQPHRATKTGQWAGVFGNLFGGDKGKHNRQHPRSVNVAKGKQGHGRQNQGPRSRLQSSTATATKTAGIFGW